MKFKLVGFIGQGFVGGSLSNNFENRGYDIVRYDVSEKYKDNLSKLAKCDLIFIAVPTPSTPNGFNPSILFSVIDLCPDNSTVVIKSTVPPEYIRHLYIYNQRLNIIYSPEFLSEDTAQADTDRPERNILGISSLTAEGIDLANAVIKTLPKAQHNYICTFEEASLTKYAGNCFFVVKNMFFNVLHDLAKDYDADWETLRKIILGDSRIHPVHTNPIHKGGRGAGGACLIKDYATFKSMVKERLGNKKFNKMIDSVEKLNISLLKNSGKSLNLLKGVYGETWWEKIKNKFV